MKKYCDDIEKRYRKINHIIGITGLTIGFLFLLIIFMMIMGVK